MSDDLDVTFDEMIKQDRQKHEKRLEEFYKFEKKIKDKIEILEFALHGADQSYDDDIYYDKELEKTFLNSLITSVREIYNEKEIVFSDEIVKFYKLFFKVSISFLFFCCNKDDYIYSSFIKISRTMDKGPDKDEESIFEIMIDSSKEYLKESFYETYKDYMGLYNECYIDSFPGIIKEAIFHYLHKTGLCYVHPIKHKIIRNAIEDCIDRINDYNERLKEEELERMMMDE